MILLYIVRREELTMTFEEACELFYNDEEVQKQFDYWKIDNAIALVNIFIDDVEQIQKERK